MGRARRFHQRHGPSTPRRSTRASAELTAEMTKRDCEETLQANGVPATAMNSPEEILASAHYAARGCLRPVDAAGAPVTVWARRCARPRRGGRARRVPSAATGLAGLRVVEAGHVLAVPLAGALLGAMGADGDQARGPRAARHVPAARAVHRQRAGDRPRRLLRLRQPLQDAAWPSRSTMTDALGPDPRRVRRDRGELRAGAGPPPRRGRGHGRRANGRRCWRSAPRGSATPGRGRPTGPTPTTCRRRAASTISPGPRRGAGRDRPGVGRSHLRLRHRHPGGGVGGRTRAGGPVPPSTSPWPSTSPAG